MNRWERKGAAKRRAREDQNGHTEEEPNDDEVPVNNDSVESPKQLKLTPFPYQQPTHAGFLTSATLFPSE